jgi:hypothetical protein
LSEAAGILKEAGAALSKAWALPAAWGMLLSKARAALKEGRQGLEEARAVPPEYLFYSSHSEPVLADFSPAGPPEWSSACSDKPSAFISYETACFNE